MTAEERIAFTKSRNLTQIDLSNCGLTEIPESIFKLTQLRTLILGKKYAPNEDKSKRNQISVLPIEISLLKNLEGLGLSFNNLTEFPSIITNLPRLQTLMLNGNPLHLLSPEIAKVRHLRILSLGNCGLMNLPEELGELRRLKVLGLASNELTNLPASFHQLRFLEQLGLANNQFDEIPSVAYQLSELQVLGLSNNQIDSFPKEIMRMKRLQKLDLKGNPLIPKIINVAAKGSQAIQYYFSQKASQQKKRLQDIVEGKKAANERLKLQDRFFRLLKSGSTICAVCDGQKQISGFIGHLNMRFDKDKCFGCEGEGVADEDNEEIHKLLEICNERKERCRDFIIYLVNEEQSFSKKIQAQRPNQAILFEETRRSIIEIIQKKRHQINIRVQQFSNYQFYEQKILIALYNHHLKRITLVEKYENDEFGLDFVSPASNLYGLAKSIEVILSEQETLFDTLIEEDNKLNINDIQERLANLKTELKNL